ncbi:putative ABC transport system permease protein [Tessaracoccus bendigoensis DSM 12906]|uniref:Putative ABC transport system permease protein n=1 Tax=Tessaracoccus bendigoensis DSM 12906 TaxID=1123357 RepID=A0A1M6C919_9ACTN|nr:ABC transporter permease [Tessaracoccus bendigoensis]SHI57244.1 putative ABC transport system permease protein [Tessaracoccus bendigoensis DSM 12906]
MSISESIKFAWRGVTANKARSALTMLGVMIGVSAVIILVAVGTGASRSVTSTLDSLGTNTLTVTPGAASGSGFGGGGFGGGGFGGGGEGSDAGPATGTEIREATLTMADAEALTNPELAPDIHLVAPVVSASSVVATLGSASHTVGTTVGSTPSYLSINNETIGQGRAFSQSDFDSHSRVLLIGTSVAGELVGGDGTDVLDQVIRLNGKEFTVIGILGAKGSSGIQDQDDRIIAPATAVQDHLAGYGNLSSISIQATSADTVDAAQAQVESILDARHRTTSDDRDFSVTNSATFLDAASTITSIFTILLGAIAAISLLVGGIGVMNIMLVTVTERTREIGIRKAIGATRTDITVQFMLEAVFLSVIGGAAGIVFGYLVCLI